MVVNDHIEIISSDSDSDIEDARDNMGSANHRTLPSWASSSGTNSRSGGQINCFQKSKESIELNHKVSIN